MNRNYFELTKEEFWFLLARDEQYSIIGLDETITEMSTDTLEKCLESLEQKEYIDNELLNTWIYALSNAKGYGSAKSVEGEQLLFYFYRDSIVSLHIKDDLYELLWILFINLAIGQMGTIISEENLEKWKFFQKKTKIVK